MAAFEESPPKPGRKRRSLPRSTSANSISGSPKERMSSVFILFRGRQRRRRVLANRQDLAGIEDVVRVERALHGAHEVERDRVLVVQELVALDEADAVLVRDRPVH